MTPVFVDGAAGLIIAVPALEGGLVLHLRTVSHNVLRVEAQRRGLGRARSDDPSQRIEHLCHPLNTASSEARWLGRHTHTQTSEWPLAFTWALFPTRSRASPLTANSLSHLVLISAFSLVPDFYFTRKQPPIDFVALYYFTIRISVDTTAP
jgi:hypothetical protein